MFPAGGSSHKTADAVDLDLFRALMASFPTGVTVVTTLEPDGSPRGMTLNALTSVSAEPPLLLICVATGSRTLAAIRHTGAFAVNVLDAGSRHIAAMFASRGPASFDDLLWHRSVRALGVPVLSDHVAARAECLVERVIEAGDHHLVIGAIVGGTAFGAAPLVYHRRGYGGVAAHSDGLREGIRQAVRRGGACRSCRRRAC